MTVTLAAPVGTVQAGQDVSAPTAAVVLAAPKPRLGLSGAAGHVRVSAPAGRVASGTDRVSVDVYSPDGLTHLAFAELAAGVQWQEVAAQAGYASLRVPLTDDAVASITDRSIIKFGWRGGTRFGCVARTEAASLAVDGTRWLNLANQPGLLSLLNEDTVYPEYYGLRRQSTQSRNFGPMSVRGAWLIASQWAHPVGASWATDPVHKKNPPDLGSSGAQWIAAAPGPSATVPFGAVQTFRREFTTDAAGAYQIVFAADDYLTLWVDGEQLFSPDYTAAPGQWQTSTTVTFTLPAGPHVLAGRVENMSYTGAHNPVAFIAAVSQLNGNGTVMRALFVTEPTNWLVTTQPVGWHPGQVLLQLITEAKALQSGALVPRGPALLATDFTFTHDSNGQPWTTTPQLFEFPVGTIGLADIATQLAESGVDIRVDPATMTLQCFNAGGLGSDKTSTVRLALGADGGTLKTADTTVTRSRFTVLLGQQGNGAWVETVDAPGVSEYGRIVAGVSLGSTSSDFTANGLNLAQLAESAQPQYTCQFRPTTALGPQPYVDYQIGDRITVPAHRGDGTMILRVLQITMDASGDVAQAYPDGVESQA